MELDSVWKPFPLEVQKFNLEIKCKNLEEENRRLRETIIFMSTNSRSPSPLSPVSPVWSHFHRVQGVKDRSYIHLLQRKESNQIYDFHSKTF